MPESENDELYDAKAHTSTLEPHLDIIQVQQHPIGDIVNFSILVVCQLAV